jgi:hypothetical protein
MPVGCGIGQNGRERNTRAGAGVFAEDRGHVLGLLLLLMAEVSILRFRFGFFSPALLKN